MLPELMQKVAKILCNSKKLKNYLEDSNLPPMRVQIGFNIEDRIDNGVPTIFIFQGNGQINPFTHAFSSELRIGYALYKNTVTEHEDGYTITDCFLHSEKIREICEMELINHMTIFQGNFSIASVFNDPVFAELLNSYTSIIFARPFYCEEDY